MIYLDNAATTKFEEKFFDIFKKYATDLFYNPSALYGQSVSIKNDIKNAKSRLKKLLKAPDNSEIIFTASGSEADNIAIFSSVKIKQSTVIVSRMEHAAVYNSALELKNRGHNVIFAPTLKTGAVDIDKLVELIDKDTELVSIIHVSNETGAINDIKEITKKVKNKNINTLVHADGVQAFGKISIDLTDLGVDLYTISAHKIGGPKGIGALYIRKGVNIKPFIFGGGQENGIRSATENVPYIMSFVAVAEEKCKKLSDNYLHVAKLKQYLLDKIQSECKDFQIISKSHDFSPYIIMLTNNKVKGEIILHHLETKDILIGTGSACSSNKHTLRIPDALSISKEYQDGIIRISFSNNNTFDEINLFVEALKEAFLLFGNYFRR